MLTPSITAKRGARPLCWRLAAAWLFTVAATCGGAEHPKQILILHSFGREYAPFNVMSATFRTELARQAPTPLEFHEVSLEATRFSDCEADSAVSAYLRALFAHRRLDLVVTVAEPASLFAAQHKAELFPETPVLASVEERSAGLAAASNTVVLSTRLELPELIRNILHALPETTNVVVILGQSDYEQSWTAECRREFAVFTNRIAITYLSGLTLEKICERAATLPPRSAIFYAMLTVDAAGVPYEQNQGLRDLRAASAAPIFGVFEHDLGAGIVGGRLLSFVDIGRELVQPALRLLAGEPARKVATPTLRLGVPSYDWRELQRWAIPPDRLPPGSVVRFRQPTQWEQHRWQILGALGVCAAEGALIVALALQLRRRRRAEATARDNADWLSLATDSAHVGVWEWNVANGTIEATAACKGIFGVAAEDPVDFTLFMARVHPEDRAAVGQAVEEAIRNQTVYDTQYRIVLPGGTIRWIAARGRGRYHKDRPTDMMGAIMDITARKQAEFEAHRHRQELAHATRLSMMGELAASLAHELNQPLAAILSNAQAARRFLAAPGANLDDIRVILDDIIRDDKRAGEVIHRLRAMVDKRAPATAELADLSDVVRDAARLLNSEIIGRQVELALNLATHLPPVSIGRVEILQVLLNLMLNAMDALRDQPAESRRISVTTAAVDGVVRAKVRDSGPGIPAGVLPDIFRPFFTTKPHGLGMGLALSRTLVESFGGTLTAGNHPEGGAEFLLDIPLPPQPSAHD